MIRPHTVSPGVKRRILSTARLLASDNEGERASAGRALGRLVSPDLLVEALDRGLVEDGAGELHWWTVAQEVVAHRKALSDRELAFAVNVAMRNTRPSVAQEKWLRAIHANLKARGVVE